MGPTGRRDRSSGGTRIFFNATSLGNDGGMSPLRWLLDRSSSSRLTKSPNWKGRVLESRLSDRSKWATHPLLSTLTPYQSDRGFVLNQFVLFIQLVPRVAW